MALFSATVPAWVHDIIEHRLHNPAIISVDASRPVESVEHTVIEVPQNHKIDALGELLDERGRGTVVVFARTKIGVEKLDRQLRERGYQVASLQGNLGQAQRERVLRGFRRGNPPILVATNVAARGLDITSIEQVINFDLPESAELLTHRLGRTGRMGRHGTAVTLVTPADARKFRAIERELGLKIQRERWGGEPAAAPVETAPSERRRPAGNRRRNARGDRPRHEAVCADCGKPTTVPFQPRADRPVYCSDCFKQRKESAA
jgi:CxxC-x17-CxxC domain-containing protein